MNNTVVLCLCILIFIKIKSSNTFDYSFKELSSAALQNFFTPVKGSASTVIPKFCKRHSECRSDQNCGKDGYCVNPCLQKACGENAICMVIDHARQCCCPPGFKGSPYTTCIPINKNLMTHVSKNLLIDDRDSDWYIKEEVCLITRTFDKFDNSCSQDCDCELNEACVLGKCYDPCSITKCGIAAFCVVYKHRPLCACKSLYVGNPYERCTFPTDLIEGRSFDFGASLYCERFDGCPPKYTCMDGKCVEPCSLPHACPRTAMCFPLDSEEILKCSCPTGMRGNPYISCFSETISFESGCSQVYDNSFCTQDCQCSSETTCIDGKCEDACKYKGCGDNAFCTTIEHQAFCFCKTGFIGDPTEECDLRVNNICSSEEVQCSTNKDCPDFLSCISNKCLWPCYTVNCGENSVCLVEGHEATCQCLDGFIGEPGNGCKRARCRFDDDCADLLTCISGMCIYPCTKTFCETYGPEYNCIVFNHKPKCISQFPESVSENPEVPSWLTPSNSLQLPSNIVSQQKYSGVCMAHLHCENDKVCIYGKCINPCLYLLDSCKSNEICQVVQHDIVCVPQPITLPSLPIAPNSLVQQVVAVCTTPSQCDYDKICYFGKCVDPCTQALSKCKSNDFCQVVSHEVICIPQETIQQSKISSKPVKQNNYQQLPKSSSTPQVSPSFKVITTSATNDCISNNQCDSNEYCHNGKCLSVCNNAVHKCSPNELCTIVNHEHVCTELLMAREKKFSGTPTECSVHTNCESNKVCRNGKCINPCKYKDEVCKFNEDCLVKDHQVICKQDKKLSYNLTHSLEHPEFVSKPIVQYVPQFLNDRECYIDNDCQLDKVCFYAKCINPCTFTRCEKLFGRTAKCFVDSHIPVCRLPVHTYCKSNLDCPWYLSCGKNKTCINPCLNGNCLGKESRCVVKNHLPLCEKNLKKVCISDEDCDSHEACFNGACDNPCNQTICPSKYTCQSNMHMACCIKYDYK